MIALLAMLYPLAFWLALDHVPGAVLVAGFACLVVARLVLLDIKPWQRTTAIALAIVFCLLSAWSGSDDASLQLFRLYPVFISFAGAVWFAWTLTTDSPATARLARLAGMTVPPERDGYLRVVTRVWVGFFVVNAGISVWTALASTPAVWALYNGLISYLLMGCLFAGEYLVRLRVQATEKANQRATTESLQSDLQ